MSIAVLFAEGFEEIEATTIVDVLRRAEFDVIMTGVESLQVTGAHGMTFAMDTLLSDLDRAGLQAVVLPGGIPGATNLRDSQPVLDLLRQTAAAGKHVAAICAAPIALQAAGLIKGKTVTSYPAFAAQLHNVTHTGGACEVDGRIVTGSGPGTALTFSLQLVRELGKPALADTLAKAMLVQTAS
jgi:4-methyl-5(b-hydroxyethyl)-thiazole monophosphate biosynthesis